MLNAFMQHFNMYTCVIVCVWRAQSHASGGASVAPLDNLKKKYENSGRDCSVMVAVTHLHRAGLTYVCTHHTHVIIYMESLPNVCQVH